VGFRSGPLLIASLLAAACASDGEAHEEQLGTTTSESSESDESTGGDPLRGTGEDPPISSCAEPTVAVGAPETIGEAVEFINALPQPVTLDCFVERLQRPLPLSLTFSVQSLQPALGKESPRAFIQYGSLIMSVAIAGDPGNTLLEFGERVPDTTKSIKAELEFPIESSTSVSAALEQVADDDGGTTCSICHRDESPSLKYEDAFASDALRFPPDQGVRVKDLKAAHHACDADAEPDRCRRLSAIFDWGIVTTADLPEELPTLGDP